MSRRSVVVALGNLDILPISDGVVKMTAAELIRPAGNNQNAWDRHPELEQGKATWELPLGGFLIRTSNRLILVDTGIGPIDNGVFRGGELLNALQVLGVEAGQITDVLLTHLHFDHIGWVSQRGVPTFPNATIRCHAQDWQWFVEGEEADEHVVRKLSSVLENVEVFETDCSLTKGVSVRHSPGHTPGSTIVVLSSGAERALLLGDVAHCPLELTENDWEGVFDLDPKTARATRDRISRELEGGNIMAVGAHFDELQFGRLMVVDHEKSWQI